MCIQREKRGFAENMSEHADFNLRRCFRSILVSLMVTVWLQGCITARPPTQTLIPPPKPAPVVQPSNQEQLEIDRLLLEATEALVGNRLTTPAEDCAYYRYLRVLSLDPDNRYALQGIHDIVEKYLDWAIRDAELKKFKRAESYLDKARTVDETHPNIKAVAEQITLRSHARMMTYRLSNEGLNIRADWITAELLEIGREVQQQNATVVITARTDAEARWIYQQLNNAAGEVRVRGEVKLGSIPSVRLIYPATL